MPLDLARTREPLKQVEKVISLTIVVALIRVRTDDDGDPVVQAVPKRREDLPRDHHAVNIRPESLWNDARTLQVSETPSATRRESIRISHASCSRSRRRCQQDRPWSTPGRDPPPAVRAAARSGLVRDRRCARTIIAKNLRKAHRSSLSNNRSDYRSSAKALPVSVADLYPRNADLW